MSKFDDTMAVMSRRANETETVRRARTPQSPAKAARLELIRALARARQAARGVYDAPEPMDAQDTFLEVGIGKEIDEATRPGARLLAMR